MRGHRLIPAHAGKTTVDEAWAFDAEAHPRSRGENLTVRGRCPLSRGSSPLTRGKLWVRSFLARSRGLIPAHAGKTSYNSPAYVIPEAHPRSRGENKRRDHCLSYSSGSSPLTRGKPALPVPLRNVSRLIPAHAGKTNRGRQRTGQ